TGATPAGVPSMVTSASRKAVPEQLSSSLATLLGTQAYQNSSSFWLWAKTSKKAPWMLVGRVSVCSKRLVVEPRPTVPPVGPLEKPMTWSAVLGGGWFWASG